MSQTIQILSYLKRHRTITPLQALDRCDCFRLAARIYDLRLQGHHIITDKVEKNGKTLGHMNYDEPPSFYSRWSWEREERERKEIYEEDLYKFAGDKIVVADLIGKEPIGHIYKGSLTDNRDNEIGEEE